MPTLESRLVRLADDLEFGIISGFFVVNHQDGRPRTIHFGNTPEPFQAQFTSTIVGQRDPVMRRLKRLSVPLVYNQSTYVNEQAGDLWEFQAVYGYKTGIAMSLHLPEDQHFCLGIDREQALPSDEASLTRMMADFHLLAMHAQVAVLRLLAPQTDRPPHRPRLTQRELEILKWTAEGKSAWAVGQILSTSEHNINYHVRRILAKLDVSSKHQAAANARRFGLL